MTPATETICHFHKVANCPCWNNDHSIEYQMGGTFTLTYGALVVEGFKTYDDAFLHYIKLTTITTPPAKRIEWDRVAREHVGYLDGEPVAWGTHRDVEVTLDRLAYDRLSGQALVRGV